MDYQAFDNQSIQSTLTTSSSNNQPWNADLENSESCFNAIFGTGLVVRTNRLHQSQDEYPPEVFETSIIDKYRQTVSSFDTQTGQRDFVEHCLEENSSTTTCLFKYDATSKTNLVAQISKAWKKGDTKVSFCGQTYVLPSIRTQYFNTVVPHLEIYLDEMLKSIASTTPLLDKSRVDVEATRASLAKATLPCVTYLTSNPQRRNAYHLMMQSLVCENLVAVQQSRFLHLLKTTQVVDTTDGVFIRVDEKFSTPQTRLESMISDESIATAVSLAYNFNYQQILHLIRYIFDSDQDQRLESKISLLSSVKDVVRNELAQHPHKVLKQCLAEHFISRQEVLRLCFPTTNAKGSFPSRPCMHCKVPIALHGNTINHGPCPVTDWLVQEFQFEYSGHQTVAPSYIYLKGMMSTYARRLLATANSQRSAPLIARTSEDFRVMAVDPLGLPRTVCQLGSKPVRIQQLRSDHRMS